MTLTLLGAGFAVGLLVGMTGTGGATLMMPVLIFGAGMSAKIAVGTDLVYAAVTKLVGSWQHRRQGTVVWPLVRDLAIGSIPSSVAAVTLMSWAFTKRPELAEVWLVKVIGAVVLFAACLMVWRAIVDTQAQEEDKEVYEYNRARMIVLGGIAGIMVGITSVGAGTLTKAILLLSVPLTIHKLVGTDLAQGALLAVASATTHMILGNVDWWAVAPLAAGTIPGALLGAKLSKWVPRRALQFILASLLAYSASRMLLK